MKHLLLLLGLGLAFSATAQTKYEGEFERKVDFGATVKHPKSIFSNRGKNETRDEIKEIATAIFVGISHNEGNHIDYIYQKQFRMGFSNTLQRDYDAVGLSRFSGTNCIVDITIDLKAWEKYTTMQKMWLVFHELGHDVYNLDHTKSGLMMEMIPHKNKITPKKLFKALREAVRNVPHDVYKETNDCEGQQYEINYKKNN